MEELIFKAFIEINVEIIEEKKKKNQSEQHLYVQVCKPNELPIICSGCLCLFEKKKQDSTSHPSLSISHYDQCYKTPPQKKRRNL